LDDEKGAKTRTRMMSDPVSFWKMGRRNMCRASEGGSSPWLAKALEPEKVKVFEGTVPEQTRPYLFTARFIMVYPTGGGKISLMVFSIEALPVGVNKKSR
jgi:hypothetical protein